MAQPNAEGTNSSEQGPPVQAGAPGEDGLTSGNVNPQMGAPGQGGADPVFDAGFDEGPDAGGRYNMEGVQQAQARQEVAQQEQQVRQGQTQRGPQERSQAPQQASRQAPREAQAAEASPQGPTGNESLFNQPQFDQDAVPPAVGVDTSGEQVPNGHPQETVSKEAQDAPQEASPEGAVDQTSQNGRQEPTSPLQQALETGELPDELNPQQAIEAARYFQNQAMTAEQKIEQAQQKAEQYEQVAPIVQEMHNDPGLLNVVSEYLHDKQGPATAPQGNPQGNAQAQGPQRAANGQFAPQGSQGQQAQPEPVERPERPSRPRDADPYSPEMEEYHNEMDEYHAEMEEYREVQMQRQQQQIQEQMQHLTHAQQEIQQRRQKSQQRQKAIQDAQYQYGLSQGEAEQFVDDLEDGAFFQENPKAVVSAWRQAKQAETGGRQSTQAQPQTQPEAPGGNQYATNPPPAQQGAPQGRQQPQNGRGGQPPAQGQQAARGQQGLPQGPNGGQQGQDFPRFASGQGAQGGQPTGDGQQDDLFASETGADPVWGDTQFGGPQPPTAAR